MPSASVSGEYKDFVVLVGEKLPGSPAKSESWLKTEDLGKTIAEFEFIGEKSPESLRSSGFELLDPDPDICGLLGFEEIGSPYAKRDREEFLFFEELLGESEDSSDEVHDLSEGTESTACSTPRHESEEEFSRDERFEQSIHKSREALLRGVKPRANKGVTGSKTLLSERRENLGIFKPELSFKEKGWVQIIKQKLDSAIGQVSLLSTDPMAQSKSEVAASMLDKIFNFNLAPCAKITRIGGKIGVFLEFLHGYREAADPKTLQQLERPGRIFTPSECTIFQKMAIFDFLIGNLDRHTENWFVRLGKGGEIIDIKCIDNANSFPKKNPEGVTLSLLSDKLYAWKKFQISQFPFTEDTKRFIRENLTGERLEALIAAFKRGDQGLGKNYFEADMERLFRQRFSIIKKIAQEEGPVTARELGEIVDPQLEAVSWEVV